MARTAYKRISISDEGILITSDVDSIDFVGSGVTISASGNALTATITGGGGSFTILTATGTIDDTNTAFSFASKPSIIVMNGISYRDGDTIGGVTAWTWDVPTLTATMFSPAGTGNSIYGIA